MIYLQDIDKKRGLPPKRTYLVLIFRVVYFELGFRIECIRGQLFHLWGEGGGVWWGKRKKLLRIIFAQSNKMI